MKYILVAVICIAFFSSFIFLARKNIMFALKRRDNPIVFGLIFSLNLPLIILVALGHKFAIENVNGLSHNFMENTIGLMKITVAISFTLLFSKLLSDSNKR